MITLTHSLTGLVHLISSVVALILGSLVLAVRKGTPLHKKLGYAYVGSMLVLIGTSFGIYHLFGQFGPFHIAALLSMSTLLTGFLPAFLRRPRVNWIRWHIAGMYYSVIGLYAAFASEVMVRIPGVAFFEMVILATVVITFLGMWFYSKKLKKWLTR